MVVVALQIRARIDDDGGGSSSEPARLRCATDVAAACLDLTEESEGHLEVLVEPAGVTASALVTLPDAQRGDIGFDGWLVPAPWPDLVNDERERRQLAPVLATPTGPLARSPLVLAARHERADVLADDCGGEIDWRCLGDVAGREWTDLGGEAGWGRLRPAHADPTVSATGLAVLGQAASDFFGNTDFSAAELDLDEFRAWLRRLEEAGPAPPFEQALAAGFVGFDTVGTSEAEAGPLLAAASADRRDAVALLYISPVATADVVFVSAAAARERDDVRDRATGDDAREALARTGWRVDGEPRARGVAAEPELRRSSGLPPAGVLQALQQRWREATGR
jgi:hypothetical protein